MLDSRRCQPLQLYALEGTHTEEGTGKLHETYLGLLSQHLSGETEEN
jgi:hypothetical protein